jgi:hypothetical protein
LFAFLAARVVTVRTYFQFFLHCTDITLIQSSMTDIGYYIRSRSYNVFTYSCNCLQQVIPLSNLRVLIFALHNCLSFTLTYAAVPLHYHFPSQWTNRWTRYCTRKSLFLNL